MAKQPFNFNLGNRALFPEELPVVDFVERALRTSAEKHGLKIKQGAAHARGDSTTSAEPRVIRGRTRDAAADVQAEVEVVILSEAPVATGVVRQRPRGKTSAIVSTDGSVVSTSATTTPQTELAQTVPVKRRPGLERVY